MRSPFGPRFPSRFASLLCIAVVTSCTSGTDPGPAPRQASTAIEGEAAAGKGEGGNERSGDTRDDSKDRVVVVDKDSKRTIRGEAPPYAEIASAEVVGTATELSLRMTLAGPLPARMPNPHSVLRVSFMLTTKDGRRFTFDAQCVRAGWGAFASGGPEDAPPPDLVTTDHGGTIAIAVDPSYIGGLQPFEWIASVAWTSGAANYAFDSAPVSGTANFP